MAGAGNALFFYGPSGEKLGSVHSAPDGALVIEVGSAQAIESLRLVGRDLNRFLALTRTHARLLKALEEEDEFGDDIDEDEDEDEEDQPDLPGLGGERV